MKVKSKIVLVIWTFVIVSPVLCIGSAGEYLVFRGACDASAAIAVSEDMFVVADDENNVLRIYETSKAGQPIASFDMTLFLLVNNVKILN